MVPPGRCTYVDNDDNDDDNGHLGTVIAAARIGSDRRVLESGACDVDDLTDHHFPACNSSGFRAERLEAAINSMHLGSLSASMLWIGTASFSTLPMTI